MKTEKLSKMMKTVQQRGILVGCLFGESYFEEGNLYIKLPVVPGYIAADVLGELGPRAHPEEIDEKIARRIGLKPLTTREICLDLFKALQNAKLGEGIESLINADDSALSPTEIQKVARSATIGARNPDEAVVAGYNTKAFLDYIRNSSVLYRPLPSKQELFFIEVAPEGGFGILSKVRKIRETSSREILEAYKKTIETLSIKSYEEAHKKYRQSLNRTPL